MDFRIFDADQHYYEAEDCFTRYASQRMVKEKFVRWVTEADGKRRRLFVGGKAANVIGNPTFDPITTPGIYHETLKKLEVGKDPLRRCLRQARTDQAGLSEQVCTPWRHGRTGRRARR